ncbi:MAG: hypothetical protein ABL877_12300 [Thiobacillus sp.]
MRKLNQIGDGLNAYTFTFGDDDLNEIRDSVRPYIDEILTNPDYKQVLNGGKQYSLPIGEKTADYYLVSYGTSPLLWLSTNTDHAYQIYKRFFEAVGIEADVKELVDYEKNIVVYCGFLVIGNKSPAPFVARRLFPGSPRLYTDNAAV